MWTDINSLINKEQQVLNHIFWTNKKNRKEQLAWIPPFASDNSFPALNHENRCQLFDQTGPWETFWHPFIFGCVCSNPINLFSALWSIPLKPIILISWRKDFEASTYPSHMLHRPWLALQQIHSFHFLKNLSKERPRTPQFPIISLHRKKGRWENIST